MRTLLDESGASLQVRLIRLLGAALEHLGTVLHLERTEIPDGMHDPVPSDSCQHAMPFRGVQRSNEFVDHLAHVRRNRSMQDHPAIGQRQNFGVPIGNQDHAVMSLVTIVLDVVAL